MPKSKLTTCIVFYCFLFIKKTIFVGINVPQKYKKCKKLLFPFLMQN